MSLNPSRAPDGTLDVLDRSGHSPITWQNDDPASIEAAKGAALALQAEGYVLFEVSADPDPENPDGWVMTARIDDAADLVRPSGPPAETPAPSTPPVRKRAIAVPRMAGG